MKNIFRKVITKLIILMCLTTVFIFTLGDKKTSIADSGFGTSYSGGGSSYSGSSSYSGGSSYSSGSSHSRDYSYSGRSSYSESDSEIGGFVFYICLILISMIIACILSKFSTKKSNIYNKRKDFEKSILSEEKIEKEIKQYIPDFDKEQFLNNGYKIYCDIQEAWMNFKLDDVKDKITDELYAMYESQLTTLEVKGEQNIMKDFNLSRSFLKDVNKQNDIITITTGYIIEFYDYIAEKESGKVLRGTDKKKLRVTYEMKFRQTIDQNKKVTKCPNCGAEVDMNVSTVCDYCHTKLINENTEWVLTEKKTLNQEFV